MPPFYSSKNWGAMAAPVSPVASDLELLGGGPCKAPPTSFFPRGLIKNCYVLRLYTLVRIINCIDMEDDLNSILAWGSGLAFRDDDGVTPTGRLAGC